MSCADRRNGKLLDEMWRSSGAIQVNRDMERAVNDNMLLQNSPILTNDEDGNPLFLNLNIGGTTFMILYDAITRADTTSFLSKFLHLNHEARLKV